LAAPETEDEILFRSAAGMTVRSTVDLESFQESLVSAFVIQQSLMDVQLPSALLTLRHLITTGEIDVNGVMHLIAGRARNLANASGAAIGWLKGDQLVYRAGSGSAVNYVGRQVTAILSVSVKTDPKGEILRVEDAQTDAGIGGAICHQFGAKSLLILPIYHEQMLGGVLQVLFNEAHAFQDSELCAYQSMASLVGEVMTHATQGEPKRSAALQLSTMPAIEQTPPMPKFQTNSGSPANSYAMPAGIAESKRLPFSRARPAAPLITSRSKCVRLHIRGRKVADRAAVVVVFVIASWIAYTYRPSALSPRAVAGPGSNTVEQLLAPVPTKVGSANKGMSTSQTASVPMKDVGKAARSKPRRVRVRDDEIDYISGDVTVRHFTRRPAVQQATLRVDQVEYVSEDVTVRRFVPMAVVPPKQAVDHAAAVTVPNHHLPSELR
jgi:hypothetical protein